MRLLRSPTKISEREPDHSQYDLDAKKNEKICQNRRKVTFDRPEFFYLEIAGSYKMQNIFAN